MKLVSIFNFFILICFYSNSGWAQNYIPLPDTNASWNVISQPNMAPPGSIIYNRITINGDTTFGGNSYKKLNRKTFDQYCLNTATYSGFSGAIRQDIANKKIFFWNGSNFEYLLYDFN